MGERIVILGNAGGGKSLIAEGLARHFRIPWHQLYSLQWEAGWVRTSELEFRKRHDQLVEGDSSIMDGVASWESIEHRVARADTLVFIDLPLWRHYWWATKRQFMCLFRPRPNFDPACPMLLLTGQLIRMMWWVHAQLRPHLIELVEQGQRDKCIYVLKTPSDVNQFYQEFCTCRV